LLIPQPDSEAFPEGQWKNQPTTKGGKEEYFIKQCQKITTIEANKKFLFKRAKHKPRISKQISKTTRVHALGN
jgi:hypothetical protein